MGNESKELDTSVNVDNAKRKLLKLGVYTVPTLLVLGKVSGARASVGRRPRRPEERLKRTLEKRVKGSFGSGSESGSKSGSGTKLGSGYKRELKRELGR